MPRKNYTSRSARRAQRMELPVILSDFMADVTAEYSVTVTNGSGFQHVTMFGSKSSVWAWAEQAGRQGGFGPGNWYPIELDQLSNVISEVPFLAIS